MYCTDNTRTIVYTVKLAENVEASLHVHRFMFGNKRICNPGFSVHTIPWKGESEVNTMTTDHEAIAHLKKWRKMGLVIERWIVPYKKG